MAATGRRYDLLEGTEAAACSRSRPTHPQAGERNLKAAELATKNAAIRRRIAQDDANLLRCYSCIQQIADPMSLEREQAIDLIQQRREKGAPRGKAKTKAKAKAKAKSKAKAKAKAKSKSKGKSKTKAKTKSPSKSAARPRTKSRGRTEAKAAAASGPSAG